MEDDSEDRSGLVAKQGRVHAASLARSLVDDFHPVDWDSQIFAGVGSPSPAHAEVRNCWVEGLSALEGRGDQVCVVLAFLKYSRTQREHERDKVVADQDLGFLRKNLVFAVITSGIARCKAVWHNPTCCARSPDSRA